MKSYNIVSISKNMVEVDYGRTTIKYYVIMSGDKFEDIVTTDDDSFVSMSTLKNLLAEIETKLGAL